MTTGNWLNKDNLQIFYGTSKASSEQGGSYVSYGSNRINEFVITGSGLSTSSSSPTIITWTDIFPSQSNMFIEKVELVTEVGISQSGTTLSIGTIGLDQATIPSGGATSFVAAISTASLSTAGQLVTLTTGSTAAGTAIGSYSGTTWTVPQYLTAYVSATVSTGIVRCRVYWHGVSTISN